ncbi:hypothetical protein GCM10011510_01750 [Streptococcus himalayensis]|uniref:Uncharacterized protein n=2 Tax=Streptococcus himalayensis TaxID=1888195 RepID=A0A917A3Q0_9STRE|nr:hypothetical protein GCM10011510_01750 [Streptococcus himalayensis]
MIDMKYSDVRSRLFKIINIYIEDEVIRLQLLEDAALERNVRGVLYVLDEYKNKNLSEEDKEFCKDLFFYF